MKLVSLISTGIDSPVSSYLLKGEVVFLHFRQGGSDETVKKIVDLLVDRGVKASKLVVVDHEKLIDTVNKFCRENEVCVYCKASMLAAAEELAEMSGCSAIVTGDNLGQVASQTLLNLKAEESLIKMPVIRPLIGLDKNEIVGLAKEIGTYSISTSFKESCPYTPKHPITSGCYVNPELKDEIFISRLLEYELVF